MAYAPFTSDYFLRGRNSAVAKPKGYTYHASVSVWNSKDDKKAPAPAHIGFHTPTKPTAKPTSVTFGFTNKS